MSFTDCEPLGLLSVSVSPVCYLRIISDYIPNGAVRIKGDLEFNCNQGKRINMQWAPARSWTLSVISFSYYSCKVLFSLCNWVQPKAQRVVTPKISSGVRIFTECSVALFTMGCLQIAVIISETASGAVDSSFAYWVNWPRLSNLDKRRDFNRWNLLLW